MPGTSWSWDGSSPSADGPSGWPQGFCWFFGGGGFGSRAGGSFQDLQRWSHASLHRGSGNRLGRSLRLGLSGFGLPLQSLANRGFGPAFRRGGSTFRSWSLNRLATLRCPACGRFGSGCLLRLKLALFLHLFRPFFLLGLVDGLPVQESL